MKKEDTWKRNLSLFFPDLEPNIQLRGEHFFQQRNVSCQECGGKFSYSRPNWECIMKTELLSFGKQDQLTIWCTTLKGINFKRIWILTHSQKDSRDLRFSPVLVFLSSLFLSFLYPMFIALFVRKKTVLKFADTLCMFWTLFHLSNRWWINFWQFCIPCETILFLECCHNITSNSQVN